MRIISPKTTTSTRTLTSYRLILFVLLSVTLQSCAQTTTSYFYVTSSNPKLITYYVNPATGSDTNNNGTTASTPFRTVGAAWNRIPQGRTLNNTGYLINLAAGSYLEYNHIPSYFESRYGTFVTPIIIQGPKTAIFKGHVNIYDCKYLYLLNFTINHTGDIFHCERCENLLLRRMVLTGTLPNGATWENVKINQSKYIYMEKNKISGASDNAIDFVSVQYGHVVANEISNAGDWCMYVKGGSSYLRIEGNIIHTCGTGGFTAGQGTGFEFMTPPWIHYEAYDIKFYNNIVRDTDGAAFGVNGGYNVILAYNTCYRVGKRSHVIEVVFGGRTCDGNTAECRANLNRGGWGTATTGGDEPIPDRNILIVNNVVYNPPGYQSAWQHFAIYGPRVPSNTSNIPSPARTDTNLVIKGNIIWNGPSTHPLGPSAGACQTSNPTCNTVQLKTNNTINSGTVPPYFLNATVSDYRPKVGGTILASKSYPLANFTDVGRPVSVPSPNGILKNSIRFDFGRTARPSSGGPPGAFVSSTSPNKTPDFVGYFCASTVAAAMNVCLWIGSTCTSGQVNSNCAAGGKCFQVTC